MKAAKAAEAVAKVVVMVAAVVVMVAEVAVTVVAAEAVEVKVAVAEVAATVARDAVVVVGMAQNPVVKRARKVLGAASVPFTYLEYGSYFSKWRQRLAIKLWSGWPTFPQVYIRGVLVGGCAELEVVIKEGKLASWIAEGPPRT